MHIIRDRMDKPLLSSIKINNIEFDGLTTNNIIVCDSIDTVETILFHLRKLEYNIYDMTVGLWQDELIEMSDLEFHNYLYEPDKWLDKIFVEQSLDCVTIQFREYAIQKFYITITPEVIYLAKDAKDVWFVGEHANALTHFNGYKEKWEDKKSLIKWARDGRYFL